VQLKTDRVYALNRTAARFWELLAARKSLGAIERKLAEEFEVGGERLRKSIERLLSSLHSKKLVRRTGKPL
jgi:hypothetical protein